MKNKQKSTRLTKHQRKPIKSHLKSLKTNKIAGAALDVFNDEPAIHKDYYKLKNVILSPHNASGTNETRLKMAVICSQNIYHYIF